ncbi:hypothetical protein GC177_05860 [bacterium]|nr:hypothetical protein [bacterium]
MVNRVRFTQQQLADVLQGNTPFGVLYQTPIMGRHYYRNGRESADVITLRPLDNGPVAYEGLLDGADEVLVFLGAYEQLQAYGLLIAEPYRQPRLETDCQDAILSMIAKNDDFSCYCGIEAFDVDVGTSEKMSCYTLALRGNGLIEQLAKYNEVPVRVL